MSLDEGTSISGFPYHATFREKAKQFCLVYCVSPETVVELSCKL